MSFYRIFRPSPKYSSQAGHVRRRRAGAQAGSGACGRCLLNPWKKVRALRSETSKEHGRCVFVSAFLCRLFLLSWFSFGLITFFFVIFSPASSGCGCIPLLLLHSSSSSASSPVFLSSALYLYFVPRPCFPVLRSASVVPSRFHFLILRLLFTFFLLRAAFVFLLLPFFCEKHSSRNHFCDALPPLTSGVRGYARCQNIEEFRLVVPSSALVFGEMKPSKTGFPVKPTAACTVTCCLGQYSCENCKFAGSKSLPRWSTHFRYSSRFSALTWYSSWCLCVSAIAEPLARWHTHTWLCSALPFALIGWFTWVLFCFLSYCLFIFHSSCRNSNKACFLFNDDELKFHRRGKTARQSCSNTARNHDTSKGRNCGQFSNIHMDMDIVSAAETWPIVFRLRQTGASWRWTTTWPGLCRLAAVPIHKVPPTFCARF